MYTPYNKVIRTKRRAMKDIISSRKNSLPVHKIARGKDAAKALPVISFLCGIIGGNDSENQR